MLYHNEPIYRDGELNGYVSSGMCGHTLGAAVALGYVSNRDGVSDDFINAGRYEIQVAARCVAAKVSIQPLYDPRSARVCS